MSQQLSDTFTSAQDPYEQTVQFDQIHVIQEYIPTPEHTVQHEIKHLMEAVRRKIQGLDKSEAPAAFSQVYGEIRRESFTKFNEIIKVYSGTKRNQYIILFYKDIDLQFEQLFNEHLPLKETYRREITHRKNCTVSRKTEHLAESEMVLKLLNLEIIELVLDWHILVDQIVDGLARCHLYQVISHNSFKELYNNINSNWGKMDTQSWDEAGSRGLESSIIWRLKNIFRRNAKTPEKNINTIDFKNLQNLISRMACQEIVFGYLKDSQCQASTKALIKVKGFLTLLIQSLDSVKNNINNLIEGTLSSYAQADRQDHQEDFENIIDQLVELEGNMTLFDRGFLKQYFKEGPRRLPSEDIHDGISEQEC